MLKSANHYLININIIICKSHYAQLSDSDAEQARDDLIKTKGFFILPSQLFCSVRSRAPLDENLNETLDAVFQAIEDSAKGSDSEANFSGLFDDIDVNSNKLGGTVAERNKRLVKLMNGVGDMKLGDYRDNTIDAFGDAYEYLMGMYASNAGKSGGEYFTPQEVSELLTRIAVAGKTEVNKVYDPACGSGSLLLKAAKILGPGNIRQGFYGQEINITTYNLCRINMFLHDIDYWIINGLFKLYSANGEMLESADWNKPYCGIQASFSFITNNEFLESMGAAFENPYDFEAKRRFLSKCEYIQRIAEEVPLLFEGNEAVSVKTFIEKYKDALIAMFRYRTLEKAAETSKKTLSDSLFKIPEPRYRNELHSAVTGSYRNMQRSTSANRGRSAFVTKKNDFSNDGLPAGIVRACRNGEKTWILFG